MTRILDCMVNYFHQDENGRLGYQRYFCYHLVAGPGPTAGAGVASISTLAVSDQTLRCTYCQNFHVVEAGGPAAALAAAVHYLDTYHQQDHLKKVQSEIRGLQADPATDPILVPEGRGRASGERGLLARKE